jgi:hypothetical protein
LNVNKKRFNDIENAYKYNVYYTRFYVHITETLYVLFMEAHGLRVHGEQGAEENIWTYGRES